MALLTGSRSEVVDVAEKAIDGVVLAVTSPAPVDCVRSVVGPQSLVNLGGSGVARPTEVSGSTRSKLGEYGVWSTADTTGPITVLAYGVGEDASWDAHMCWREMAKGERGSRVISFDPTEKAGRYLRGVLASQQALAPCLSLQPVGLGATTGPYSFYPPKNTDHVSFSLFPHEALNTAEKVTLQLEALPDTLARLNLTSAHIIKVDIEGSEFDVLSSWEKVYGYDLPFCQFLVEWHERFFRDGRAKRTAAHAYLARAGFWKASGSPTSWEQEEVYLSYKCFVPGV
jgi:FkbM family methyltransferase